MKKIKIVDEIDNTTDEQLTKIANWFVSFKDDDEEFNKIILEDTEDDSKTE